VQFEKGDCAEGGRVVSNGFEENVPEGSLHGVVGDKPGKYVATAYCKGHAYAGTSEFEVVPLTANDRFSLDKAEYAPGELIEVTAPVSANCTGNVTSAGFVAPLKLTRESDQLLSGTIRAVGTPGSYEASMTCDNVIVTQSFKVTAKPQAKAPVVKPKGAPQTGGGGTA
ncbi:MAG TPA: hypothetical protein VF821_27745, partial [Lentzea sp.]